jgi:hypothetical protein
MSDHVARHARQADRLELPHAYPGTLPEHAGPPPRRMRLFVVVGIVGVIVVGAVVVAIVVSASSGSTIGYGTPVATIASKLHCTGSHPSPSSTDDIDLGIHPLEEILCTLDGHVIDISTWADRASQARAESVAHAFVHNFGLEVYLARGPGWLAGLNDESATPDVAAEKSVAEKLARKLLGAVVHWN